MIDVFLGTVAADRAGGLNDLLRCEEPALRDGRFDLVGRYDPAENRVMSAALTRNLGNDQWSVYLLDEAALDKIVRSEFCELRDELLERGALYSDVAAELGRRLEGTGLAAGHGLGHHLALEGVVPNDTHRVAREERSLLNGMLEHSRPHANFGLEIDR